MIIFKQLYLKKNTINANNFYRVIKLVLRAGQNNALKTYVKAKIDYTQKNRKVGYVVTDEKLIT